MSQSEKPLYRVAIAGLEARDARLIEIVFRHSRYNRVGFELVRPDAQSVVDILVANPYDTDGLRAMARARAARRPVPVVVVVPDGREPRGRYAIELDKLPLQLLPTLNRIVRAEMEPRTPAPQVFRGREDARREAASAASPEGAPVPPEVAPVPPEVAPDARGPVADRALAGLGRRGRATAIAVEPAPTDDDKVSATLIFPLSGFGDTWLPATRFPPALNVRPHPPRSVRAPGTDPEPEFQAGRTEAVPAGVAAGPPIKADPRPPGVTVLVVDDSPTVRRQLVRALGRWGIDSVAVSDAAMALDVARSRHFELALVDVVMPGENGFTLTRELRRLAPSMPVVLLTHRGTPIDLARGALAGCAAYLRKPIKPARLQAEVMAQLRKTLAIDDLAAVLRPPRPADAGQSHPPDRTTPSSSGAVRSGRSRSRRRAASG